VTLSGGSRVMFDPNSEARMVRDGSVLALLLQRGGAAFTSSSKSLVEARMLDVTLRPQNPAAQSIAYISYKDSKHAVLYADRGAWLVTSAHDGNTIVLQPGNKLEGAIAPLAQDPNDPQNKKNKKKWAIFWIGGALGVTATALGLAFGKSECTLQGGGNGYNPSCTISPVTPSDTGGGVPQ
jgi:ferric-dicitrate binding protein FerR (iron transport regulator)